MPRREHTLDVQFITTAKVKVVANCRTEAKELIEKNVALSDGRIYSTLPDNEVDWFDVVSVKVVTK